VNGFRLVADKTDAVRCCCGRAMGKPEIVTNRDTYRAKNAKRAISDIAESITCLFSTPMISSTPPASTNLESITQERMAPWIAPNRASRCGMDVEKGSICRAFNAATDRHAHDRNGIKEAVPVKARSAPS
jgi:hypothetical protein